MTATDGSLTKFSLNHSGPQEALTAQAAMRSRSAIESSTAAQARASGVGEGEASGSDGGGAILKHTLRASRRV